MTKPKDYTGAMPPVEVTLARIADALDVLVARIGQLNEIGLGMVHTAEGIGDALRGIERKVDRG